MFMLYIIAVVPIVLGAIYWAINKRVVWWEWLIGAVVALILSTAMHTIVITGMGADDETWSGTVQSVHHTPEWKAQWIETETYIVQDSKGNVQTKTRIVTKRKTHYANWYIKTNIGQWDIKKQKYLELKKKFGAEDKKKGSRRHYKSGDKYDYHLVNKNKWVEPVTTWRMWHNRVKASPSVFEFPPVPKEVKVFNYPKNNDKFRSDRLVGAASNHFKLLEFDRMNGHLGPRKKVNIIIVAFPKGSDPMIGKWQEAAWIGGKKNDLVITYALNEEGKAEWAYAFGWTEEELVKRNLETLFLQNKVGTELLPQINKEVMDNYKIKDWSKFDYITIVPPLWSYITLVIVMILAQGGLFVFFHFNQADKDTHGILGLFKK